MFKLRLIFFLAVLTLIFTSISGAEESTTAPLVAANNGFAANLYRQLYTTPGNIFVSPYSITAVLDMTYAGAAGATAEQMKQTLGLNFDPTQLHPMSSALMSSLNSRQGYELSVANCLWGQTGVAFRPKFLDLTQRFYSAGFKQANFHKADTRERARLDINSWVEDKTRQRIKDILSSDSLDEYTSLVLVNAIYFKAAWSMQFEKSLTKDADFILAGNRKVKVSMMHNTDYFGYAETDKLQILKAPYAQNEMAMYIILPKRPADLASLEAGLTSNQLKTWFDSALDRKVSVFLPKFKMEKKYELADVLSSMGMRDAFDDQKADFSNMAALKPDERLFISRVIHQTFVEVDEKGTEAAAATATIMVISYGMPLESPKPVEFKADHPFIFVICDNATGSILFMGRLSDPQ